MLVDEEGSAYMADNDGDSDAARTLRTLQAAACTDRITFGSRAGQKVLTGQGAMPSEKDFKQSPCANMQGFSLHVAVRYGADDRQPLEHLCRYIARPALVKKTRTEFFSLKCSRTPCSAVFRAPWRKKKSVSQSCPLTGCGAGPAL